MNGTRNSLSKNAPPLHFERAYIKITFCGKWSIFANHVTFIYFVLYSVHLYVNPASPTTGRLPVMEYGWLTDHMTHLYVKPSLLQLSDQWQTSSDGIRLTVPCHVLCGIVKMFEPKGVEVARNTLGGGGGGLEKKRLLGELRVTVIPNSKRVQ